MPFLRFSRDARGYESTYLCHTFRRSSGPPELRVLYWFRSPPDVKVGRPALAPDVIRAIEESNPTLRFDWDKILKVKPPPPPDPGRAGRDERRPRRRRGKDAAETKSPATSSRSATPSRAPSGESAASRRTGSAEVPAKPAEAVDAGGSASDLMPQPGEVGVDTDEPLRHVALAVTDDEGLARLRARYAEIQTRIGDRFRDPARLEELRAQAALIDPDGWRTIDEARARIASLDDTTAALRKILGRRRRVRRGRGRRRRRPSDESGATVPEPAASVSESDPVAPPVEESAAPQTDGDDSSN